LWLLPTSWQRWADVFSAAGYAPVLAGWPDDPDTVEEANAHQEVFARKSVGQVADHFCDLIGKLDRKPAVIGHSFGGLITQTTARPRPVRRVRSHRPGAVPRRAAAADYRTAGGQCRARQPGELPPGRAADLRPIRYGFANAVTEEEARELYETFAVPASGEPLFQAAVANVNPWTEAKVDTTNPERGPLLIISGEKDHTVPWAIANASYKQQSKNPNVTEILEIPGRGHSLTIDSGWREICDTALAFVQRFC
jgi:pimeloyl-ACP methyl ester carboxylesterase